jgi:O-antigen/teichoic acid export membrane protein
MKISETWRAMSRTSPFGSSAVLTAGTNAVLAMFGLVTGVLAARLLGPNGRGELAAIQTWPAVIATIAMLGMPETVYYAARESNRAGLLAALHAVAPRQAGPPSEVADV